MTNELKRTKATLEHRASVRRLRNPTVSEDGFLQLGLDDIPVHKMIQHAQYIDNVLLPRIEKSKGKESDEYKHFDSIITSLLWAIKTLDQRDRLMLMWSNERLLCEFYREKALFYEQELLYYTTSEDLLMGETFKMTARALSKSADERIRPAKVTTPDETEEDIPL